MDKNFTVIKKKFIINTIILIIVLWGFNNGYCDPIISNVGQIIDGQAVTIIGSDFGQKSTAQPLSALHDNIESGNSGDLFSAPGWVNDNVGLSTTPNTDSIYTTDKAHSGNKSILFDFTNAIWCQNRFDSGTNGGLSPIYFTAWVYFERLDNQGYSNNVQWKLWRHSSTPGYSTNDEPGTSEIINDWWITPSNSWFGSTIGYYNGSNNHMTTNYGRILTPSPNMVLVGQWQRLEMYATMSSAPNTPDGTFKFSRVGQAALTQALSMTTNDSDDKHWRYIRIGQMYNDNDGDTGDKAKIYYDDIYVDNTQARVEIGNNPNWSNCTHREIQIPSAWSSTSITATIKQGSFTDGQQAWLFVVDSNGVVSSGKEIIFEKSLSANVPMAPANLEIQ